MCLTKEQPICQQLGGDKSIIVIDTLFCSSNSYPLSNYFIGMVELKSNPIRTHFEHIEFNNNIDIHTLVELIRTRVAPGTWIVFEDRVYEEEMCKLLSQMYPVVVKRSELEVHNTNTQNAVDNLTLVWKHALRSAQCKFDLINCDF